LSVLCGRTLEPLETHTFTEDGRVRVEVRGEGVTHVQTGVARLDAYDVLCVAEDVITLVGGHDDYLIYVPSRRRVRVVRLPAGDCFTFLRPRELVVNGRLWVLLNDDGDWGALHMDALEGRPLPVDVGPCVGSRGNFLASERWDDDAVVTRNAHASVYMTGHGGAVSPCGRFVACRVGWYGSDILRFLRVLTFEELLEGILRESRCARAAVLREGPIRRRLAQMLGVLE